MSSIATATKKYTPCSVIQFLLFLVRLVILIVVDTLHIGAAIGVRTCTRAARVHLLTQADNMRIRVTAEPPRMLTPGVMLGAAEGLVTIIQIPRLVAADPGRQNRHERLEHSFQGEEPALVVRLPLAAHTLNCISAMIRIEP